MIDTRSGMSAVGNMDDFMKFQMGQSMEKAAENPTGNAGEGMGLGAGMGMGFMIPQMMNQAMQQNNQSADTEEDSFSKLKKLKELLDMGAIDQEEFNETKKRILNNL